MHKDDTIVSEGDERIHAVHLMTLHLTHFLARKNTWRYYMNNKTNIEWNLVLHISI